MTLFILINAIKLSVCAVRSHFSGNREKLGCLVKIEGNADSPCIASAEAFNSALVACVVCCLVVEKGVLSANLGSDSALVIPSDSCVGRKISCINRLFEQLKCALRRNSLCLAGFDVVALALE